MFENEEASHYQNGVYLRPRTYDLQESTVRLKLTIVDTVGFGDQINKEDRWATWIKNQLSFMFLQHFSCTRATQSASQSHLDSSPDLLTEFKLIWGDLTGSGEWMQYMLR